MARGATDPAGGAVRGEAETCRWARRGGGDVRAVIDTSPNERLDPVRGAEIDSWTISENLRPASDKYTAKRKGQSVRWRF